MSESVDTGLIEEAEISSEDICKKYRKISRFRPPFHFEAPTPSYLEADETRLFELEKDVFSLESYPLPPDEPFLKDAYEGLKQKHKDLTDGIQEIISLDALHEDDPQVEAGIQEIRNQAGFRAHQHQNSPEQKAVLFEKEKEHWEKHYKAKKLFFHQALSYLYLLEGYHPNEEDRRKSRRLRRETYAMFIGHQATTYSRSASHELGPVRRDKQPTIKHPYMVAVHGINFWLQKVDEAQNEEEEAELFEELNMEIIRDLFHDTQEDYYITESDLACKLIEMLNFDFRVSTRFRESDSKTTPLNERRTPENINFACAHRNEIMTELWALTEEEEDKDPGVESEYYLVRKISQIPRQSQVRVCLSKIRDRMNNLQSPRYKKVGKTLIKLHETLKIIDIGFTMLTGLELHQNPTSKISAKDVSKELMSLAQVCFEQMQIYKGTEEFIDLCQRDSTWDDYWEITNQQLLHCTEALKRNFPA